MKRSTNNEKSQRLRKAFELVAHGYTMNRAAALLVGEFGISLRQAYRYLKEAQRIGQPMPIVEPGIPITIKIPRSVALKLRTYAQTSNLTMGEIVGNAILTFLTGEGFYG
jgi:hypothetical protein